MVVVALPVCHLDMSLLKSTAPLNIDLISTTFLGRKQRTSHKNTQFGKKTRNGRSPASVHTDHYNRIWLHATSPLILFLIFLIDTNNERGVTFRIKDVINKSIRYLLSIHAFE